MGVTNEKARRWRKMIQVEGSGRRPWVCRVIQGWYVYSLFVDYASEVGKEGLHSVVWVVLHRVGSNTDQHRAWHRINAF